MQITCFFLYFYYKKQNWKKQQQTLFVLKLAKLGADDWELVTGVAVWNDVCELQLLIFSFKFANGCVLPLLTFGDNIIALFLKLFNIFDTNSNPFDVALFPFFKLTIFSIYHSCAWIISINCKINVVNP